MSHPDDDDHKQKINGGKAKDFHESL